MRMLTIVVFLLLEGGVQTQTVKDGFKGFEWGTPRREMDSLFDLDSVGEEVGFVSYLTNIDSLAGADLSSSDFQFYKNRFAGVMITTKNRGNWSKLLEAFKSAYGIPEKENQYIEEYWWKMKNTWRYAKYNEITKEGSFVMVSMAIYNEAKEDQKKAAEKAKREF